MVDDFVTVCFENKKPFASPLYSSAKVHKKFMPRFSELEKSVSHDLRWEKDEKSLCFLYPRFASKIITQFPLRAIAVARYTRKEKTTIEEISQIAALSAIAPHTLLQLPDSGDAEFESLKKLTQSLPCYRLHAGTRLSEIPENIEKLLGKLKVES